ncbi:MAG TPA: peptidoglycan DD-metalloendopeptidase family protein [Gallionellaceae bacterium]
MTLQRSTRTWLWVTAAMALLAGCKASGNHRAPVEDRYGSGYRAPVEDRGDSSVRKPQASTVAGKPVVSGEAEKRTRVYVVKKGDTLYSIAFENGLDYREVAEQNNISNPGAIQIGQQIKLQDAESAAVETASAVTTPSVKSGPKVVRLPYSEQAVAQIDGGQAEVAPVSPVIASSAVSKPPVEATDKEVGGEDAVQWSMPTKGKLIAGFSESANRKGVDISGNKGQAVQASAAGKVVYSGSGLRGYGKLVIIKHNKTYLSAYAHNDKILVKEGQNVNKGQKIAEMGNSDADQVKLHFEIRKFGKPVDPAKYLNLPKP